MSRIEVRRQRWVRNRWSVSRYTFIDGPAGTGGRGLCVTAGRWIAHLDYHVRPLPREFQDWIGR